MDSTRLDRWVARKPKDFSAQFNLGFSLYQQGKLGEAELAFRSALKLCPADPHLNVCLGHISLVLGHADDAIEFLETAISSCHMYAEAHALLGSAREAKGELISAELSWHRAIAYDSRMGIAHFNLARMYAICSDTDRAVDHLSKAIRAQRVFRKEAKCCPDFDRIFNHPEFRDLVFGRAA